MFGRAGQGVRRRCSFQTHVYTAWSRVLFLWVKEGLLSCKESSGTPLLVVS